MKRYGRATDILKKSLQLSGISYNDEEEEEGCTDTPGMQPKKRKKRKLLNTYTTVMNYDQNQVVSGVSPSMLNPTCSTYFHNEAISPTLIIEAAPLEKETAAVIQTFPCSSPSMQNPTSSTCFLNDEIRCHNLSHKSSLHTLTTEATVPQEEDTAAAIQNSPCSSPSVKPTCSACFLDETTGEFQSHDLVLSQKSTLPSLTIKPATPQEVTAAVIQNSPCSSSSVNPTCSACFLDETTGEFQSHDLVLSHKPTLPSLRIKPATPQEDTAAIIQNSPRSSPSLIPTSSACFLDETTGEIQRHDLVLSNTPYSRNPVPEKGQQNEFSDDQDATYEPDNTYSTDAGISEGEIGCLVKKRRGIRRLPKWDRNRQKLRRMQGKNYNGLIKREGKWTQSNSRPAREIKNACNCVSAKFECRKLTEEARKDIHDKFWGLLHWEQRKVYVASLVTKVQPVSRRQNIINSRRNMTLNYHLRLNETRIHVCKKMFLNTLDLGEKSVRAWCVKAQSGIPDPKTPPTSQTHTERDNHLQSFLNNLPKMESHYCRANSTKIYLERSWDSLKELHSFYQQVAAQDNIKPFSWTHFVQELKRQNITLFQNRKDQCDTCFSFKESRVDKSTYDLHILRKDMGRNAKSEDKILAEMDNKMKVFCVDVQAVLLAPKLNVSLAYYKIKLKLHNFTSYDLITRKGRCYLWDECNGGLDAEVFASLYVDLLKTEFERSEANLTKIVLWSDGCCYQNRNQVVANAILNCSVELGITIEQKYLEHGHTFMEVDSEHSVIERKIKKNDIYIPAQYIDIIKSARTNPTPYEVDSLKYNFFKDYSKIQYYTSIRPGNRAGDNVVNDIRCLKYNPNGTIEYKLLYNDDWTLLPRRTKLPNPNIELPLLYDSKIKITLRKFHDLQDLKVLIHENYHSYYDTLPHECLNQTCPHVK